MNPEQRCPRCGRLNFVAGLFRTGKLHKSDNPDNSCHYSKIRCIGCELWFDPKDDSQEFDQKEVVESVNRGEGNR